MLGIEVGIGMFLAVVALVTAGFGFAKRVPRRWRGKESMFALVNLGIGVAISGEIVTWVGPGFLGWLLVGAGAATVLTGAWCGTAAR